MSIVVSLSDDELTRIKQLTKLDSDAAAVSQAVREFLRMTQLRELKAASGKVDFADLGDALESLELREIQLPR